MTNLTNCKNCGAPLHGSVCEYCGTEYDSETVEMPPDASMILCDRRITIKSFDGNADKFELVAALEGKGMITVNEARGLSGLDVMRM